MKINTSKNFLYNQTGRYKEYLGYKPADYNIDIISLFREQRTVLLEEVSYSSGMLRGVALFGRGNDKDIILLNKQRSDIEKQFDCCHAALHLWLHRDVGVEIFNCFDEAGFHENHIYEWQASEGSEEFFIPYQALLPLVMEKKEQLESWDGIQSLKRELSALFNTPDYVIDYRLESLKYEIQQYLEGTPLDEVKLLSVWEQKKRGIIPRSIKDMEMDLIKTKLNSVGEADSAADSKPG